MVAIKREFLLHNGNNSRVFQGSVWRASSVKFAVVIDFTPCPLRAALSVAKHHSRATIRMLSYRWRHSGALYPTNYYATGIRLF